MGLKSKMYTFTTVDNHKCKKEKCIYKNVVVKDYKNILFNRSNIAHEMNRI